MRPMHRFAAALALALTLLVPHVTHADGEYLFDKETWPVALTLRPLVLAPKMVEIGGDTMYINMSSGAVGDPVTLAPHIYYGITSKITAGIDHRLGYCISDVCPSSYNDLTLRAFYGLVSAGYFHAAAQGGLSMPSLDPFSGGLDLGIMAKLQVSVVALVLGTHVYLGALGDERTRFRIPIQLQYQLQRENALVLDVSVERVLTGGSFDVPLGLGYVFSLGRRVDIGARFQFENFANNTGRFDARALVVQLALRL